MKLLCINISLRNFVEITFTPDFFHYGVCKNRLTVLLTTFENTSFTRSMVQFGIENEILEKILRKEMMFREWGYDKEQKGFITKRIFALRHREFELKL